jgi:hypothetical protein
LRILPLQRQAVQRLVRVDSQSQTVLTASILFLVKAWISLPNFRGGSSSRPSHRPVRRRDLADGRVVQGGRSMKPLAGDRSTCSSFQSQPPRGFGVQPGSDCLPRRKQRGGEVGNCASGFGIARIGPRKSKALEPEQGSGRACRLAG